MFEKNPWQTLNSKEVYDNPWINVSHREVINPGGGKGIYGKVHFKNIALGILPLDAHNNTWIVGQYRYTLEEYSWEIPEGGGLFGIDPLLSAQRELKEETGLIANTWIKILDMNTSNSVTDELGIAYVAKDLSQKEAEPEESEDLKIRKLPFDELYEMLMNGEIKDALSMITIFKTKELMLRGEL